MKGPHQICYNLACQSGKKRLVWAQMASSGAGTAAWEMFKGERNLRQAPPPAADSERRLQSGKKPLKLKKKCAQSDKNPIANRKKRQSDHSDAFKLALSYTSREMPRDIEEFLGILGELRKPTQRCSHGRRIGQRTRRESSVDWFRLNREFL